MIYSCCQPLLAFYLLYFYNIYLLVELNALCLLYIYLVLLSTPILIVDHFSQLLANIGQACLLN
jgi:hypothetical protein